MPEVSFMACQLGNDLRTATGRNLWLFKTKTGLHPCLQTPASKKKVLREKDESLGILASDEWRVSYLALLPEQRQQSIY